MSPRTVSASTAVTRMRRRYVPVGRTRLLGGVVRDDAALFQRTEDGLDTLQPLAQLAFRVADLVAPGAGLREHRARLALRVLDELTRLPLRLFLRVAGVLQDG